MKKNKSLLNCFALGSDKIRPLNSVFCFKNVQRLFQKYSKVLVRKERILLHNVKCKSKNNNKIKWGDYQAIIAFFFFFLEQIFILTNYRQQAFHQAKIDKGALKMPDVF